ncbi:plastocyanin/azurin family copper-binding protein [Gracilimonas sp.]|uniref:cupredoxin domain-containing protein n=1 Tax=Gracilimonas sp. TaxID=1974203 RepID=UPI0028724703|nr:plastocyanin/azurin family copper-binding protein [Gracilimonas sp.]
MKSINKNPLLLFIFTVLISFSMIGCSDNSSGTTNNNNNNNGNGNGGSEPSGTEVEMVGQSFSPQNIEVEVGTTVTWVNESTLIHTVTSGSNGDHDGIFDSGNIAENEEFSYTFEEVGTFDYFCRPHVNNGMVGTVTVVESDSDSNDY